MKIRYYCPHSFEPWDHRNYDETGIGGSETCVCETSKLLAERGYDVKVYAPLGEDCPPEWNGVTWLQVDECDPSEEAIWIIWRNHDALDIPFQGQVWVMYQDVNCPGELTPDRAERVDIAMAMSEVHAKNLRKMNPLIADKVRATKNGVRVDLFEEIEAEGGVERNPNKAIFASSPDRGLIQAVLPLWPRIRESVPDAELHIYYGWDNIDKIIARDNAMGKHYEAMKGKALKLLDQPNVFWHGRTPQKQLYREWLGSNIWPHFSDFKETSCINSMEAQAGGAIPITNPYWAVGEHVRHGVFVNGLCYSDPLSRASLVAGTIQMFMQQEWADSIRPEMMADARNSFCWERVVDQWEQWIHGWNGNTSYQYPFQHRHLIEKTLNVGCNADSSDLKSRGDVLNVDLYRTDPNTGCPIPADEIVDARSLPFEDSSFDTVILGDILEHCQDGDAKKMIAEARRVGRKKIIITFPEDYRGDDEQRKELHANTQNYVDDITGYHSLPMTRERMVRLIGKAPDWEENIRYIDTKGHGMVVNI